jgi:hypothetical protein
MTCVKKVFLLKTNIKLLLKYKNASVLNIKIKKKHDEKT